MILFCDYWAVIVELVVVEDCSLLLLLLFVEDTQCLVLCHVRHPTMSSWMVAIRVVLRQKDRLMEGDWSPLSVLDQPGSPTAGLQVPQDITSCLV